MRQLFIPLALLAASAAGIYTVTAPALAEDFKPFDAPELRDVSDWVNTKGTKLADHRGKVVVVHFFTTGCINCIHNYPSYNVWQEKLDPKQAVVIGIHTPEFDSEKKVDGIRTKADNAKLKFPIAVDNDQSNWKAWGLRYWPTVFLVDKKGKVRARWEGELNYSGTNGEKQMREKIDALIGEKE